MKKKKKLQLHKETIAILNGEKMSQIIGGGADVCPETAEYKFGEAGLRCYCKEGFGMNEDGKCVTFDLLVGLTSMLVPGAGQALCLGIGLTINYCPIQGDTGIVKCPTKPYCD